MICDVRVQALLDHRQDNQSQSSPSPDAPTEDVGPRLADRTSVANHLALGLLYVNASAPLARGPGCGRAHAPVLGGTLAT